MGVVNTEVRAMAVGFGSNLIALRIGRNLERASTQVSKSFERLSSGERINRGSDDAAGLAISGSLNARSRIYGQSIRNINDAVSQLNVVSSAVSGLSELVNRLAELSAQAANGTLSGKQRIVINKEASALVAEYNRTVESTQYGGIAVLDGTADNITLSVGVGEGATSEVRVGQEMGSSAGSGAVGAATTNSNGSLPYDVAVADFNSDGNADIVSSDFAANAVGVYLGTGTGSFGSVTRYAAGVVNNQVWDVATGDFNQDGREDITTANRDGTMGVLLGNGNGTFQSAQTNAASGTPIGVAVGDLNNDGMLDIVTNGISTGMDLYLGKGNGTFTRQVITSGATASRVTIGDLNSDGNQDLVVNSGIFFGNGDGSFKSVTALPGSSSPITSSVVTDLNKDGIADLVTSTTDSVNGSVGVYLGTGGGSLSNPVHYSVTGYSDGIVNADVNGDGAQDIAVSGNGGLRIFTGKGDGTLNASVAYAGSGHSLAVGDFNNDAINDFAVSQYAGGSAAVLTFLGNPDPSGRRKNVIDTLDLSSIPGARAAVDWCRSQVQKLAREQGMLGAFQSRLETQISNLSGSRFASMEAASRITDADIAEEMSGKVRAGVLQNVSVSLLAQANLQPEVALQVLQREVGAG